MVEFAKEFEGRNAIDAMARKMRCQSHSNSTLMPNVNNNKVILS